MDVKEIKVAFLAVDAVPEPHSTELTGQELRRATWKKDLVLAAIHQIDPVADVVVVLVHWGDEYETRAGPNQEQAAQEMVDAGADVVIGSHPHVVQETQIFEQSDPAKSRFCRLQLRELCLRPI